MKKSRFTDSQIMAILKQHEAGVPVSELAREHNVSTALIYQWRSKFGGMDASMMKRLKELEAENARLKKMYAEERLKAELRRESSKAISTPGDGQKGRGQTWHQYPFGLRGVWHQRDLLSVPGKAQWRERSGG